MLVTKNNNNKIYSCNSRWNAKAMHVSLITISCPVSSGFLVSGATPGRLWGHRKNSIFLIGCSVTVSIVLPQKSCGNKIRCPQSLPGVAPLTKKPEDSGYEIALIIASQALRKLTPITFFIITHIYVDCFLRWPVPISSWRVDNIFKSRSLYERFNLFLGVLAPLIRNV